MPLYEFECEECRENFETLRRFADRSEVECPRCGSKKTLKKLSAFAMASKGNSGGFGSSAGSDCAPGGT